MLEKIKKLNSEYIIKLREILYWEKVNKKFKKNNIKKFSISFKHKRIKSQICYDDELRIKNMVFRF